MLKILHGTHLLRNMRVSFIVRQSEKCYILEIVISEYTHFIIIILCIDVFIMTLK